MVLPLAGLCVFDLSNVLTGPFCSYQLGSLGVEVIKIEAPGNGDFVHRLRADPRQARRKMGTPFVAVNAGERSVTVNLKHPEGCAVPLKSVMQADTLIENYRPSVMNRLKLGYDVLREINPHLVYCVTSGFGKDGPFSDRLAYDQIIQGISGVMGVTDDDASAPLYMGYPISDTVSGITAALAVTTCLLGTRRMGQSCMMDVSMLESTLTIIGWVVSSYLNAGMTPHPIGSQNFTATLSGIFRMGDGLINIAANEDRQFATLCHVVGHPEFAVDARSAGRHTHKEHRQQLNDALEAVLTARSAAG